MRIPRLTFPAVVATAAVALVFTTGTAYAINEWTGANIKNGTLTGKDIKTNSVPGGDIQPLKSVDILDGSLTSLDILNGTLTSADILDGTLTTDDVADGTLTSADVLDETLTASDLAANSVGALEIQTDGVQASEIMDNSIDSGEIVDFGLSNQDIGVLFAQVNADGTVANSSGGVTVIKFPGDGTYEVDFGRNISNCAFLATQGGAGVGSSAGAIIGVTDRSGNVEAVFAAVRDAAGVLIDRDFQLLVVC